MSKISRRVRFRGTSMTGWVTKRLIHNNEVVYSVCWDCDAEDDPRPYTPNELEPLPLEERRNLQIIKKMDAMDRKWWEEQMTEHGTVEEREQFRGGTFERI
jgi:hypothetical protein